MASHALTYTDSEVPTVHIFDQQRINEGCSYGLEFSDGKAIRRVCSEHIVSSDYETFFLASRCDVKDEKTKLYLFTKEGKYTRKMKNEIIRSSWRRNWTDEFQAEVEAMREVKKGANLNTCFNMKPKEGVVSHKLDGRWITAKSSGHVRSCVALQPQHSQDIQHLDIEVYNGTTCQLLRTTTAQTLEPGKFSGGNLFNPALPMTLVHTLLDSDTEYNQWALFHQCATTNGKVDENHALVIYKDGAIGRAALEKQIELVLKSSKWPRDFKTLVRATYVADGNELCRDEFMEQSINGVFCNGVPPEEVVCSPYNNSKALDDWSFTDLARVSDEYPGVVTEETMEHFRKIENFTLTMASHALTYTDSEVPTVHIFDQQRINEGCSYGLEFSDGKAIRRVCSEHIVSSDYETFFLASRCDVKDEKTKLYLFTKEGKYTRKMKNEIIRSSWRRNWTDEFQAEVEAMREVKKGANLNTCFNMKPKEGVVSHKLDGRWITAKSSGHVRSCVALQPQHSQDIQHLDIEVYNGTTCQLLRTTTAQTLEPGKFSGGNLFNPALPMTLVHTLLDSDTDYNQWALYHQCATTNGTVDEDHALVIYKDGAIGREALEKQIKLVLKSSKWPRDFKRLVRATYVADGNELCRDEFLHSLPKQFTAAQLASTYMDAPEPSVPDTWYSKWEN